MPKSSRRVILLGEGDTEKKVLNALGVIGLFKQFNIQEKDIFKLFPSLGGAELWLYVDTDKADNEQEFIRFANNIAILKKSRLIFKVYLQVRHLEDELARACKRCIYQGFDIAKGSSELKDKIIECRNLERKLLDLQIDKTKLWQQSHAKCDEFVKIYRSPKVVV